MKKLAILFGLLFIVLLLLTGCADREGTIELLENQGYTNITILGYDPFSCSEGDSFSTGFKATSASGHVVTGTVCRDAFRGSSIRFH